jgi:hypothetical protein
VITVPRFLTAADSRPPRLGYHCLVPKDILRLPCLQNKVHDLGLSPSIGGVPASESALRKLNDRKVKFDALKDYVKGSQAQDTQADAGRSSLEPTLVSLLRVLVRNLQSWLSTLSAFHQADMQSDVRR